MIHDNILHYMKIRTTGEVATPPSGYVAVYAKNDGYWYTKDPLGSELPLSEISSPPITLQPLAYKGYCCGGYVSPSAQNKIDDMDFSNDTSAQLAFILGYALNSPCGFSSPSVGYLYGGYSGGLVSWIQKLLFNNVANTITISNTCTEPHSSGNGMSTYVNGYALGGGSATQTIDRFTYLGESATRLSASMQQQRRSSGAVFGSLKGYCCAGVLSGTSTNIESFDFANELTAATSMTLDYGTYKMFYMHKYSFATNGIIGGGKDYDTSTMYYNFRKITFLTETYSSVTTTITDPYKAAYGASVNSRTKGYYMGGNGGVDNLNKSFISYFTDVSETWGGLSATLDTARGGAEGLSCR